MLEALNVVYFCSLLTNQPANQPANQPVCCQLVWVASLLSACVSAKFFAHFGCLHVFRAKFTVLCLCLRDMRRLNSCIVNIEKLQANMLALRPTPSGTRGLRGYDVSLTSSRSAVRSRPGVCSRRQFLLDPTGCS